MKIETFKRNRFSQALTDKQEEKKETSLLTALLTRHLKFGERGERDSADWLKPSDDDDDDDDDFEDCAEYVGRVLASVHVKRVKRGLLNFGKRKREKSAGKSKFSLFRKKNKKRRRGEKEKEKEGGRERFDDEEEENGGGTKKLGILDTVDSAIGIGERVLNSGMQGAEFVQSLISRNTPNSKYDESVEEEEELGEDYEEDYYEEEQEEGEGRGCKERDGMFEGFQVGHFCNRYL